MSSSIASSDRRAPTFRWSPTARPRPSSRSRSSAAASSGRPPIPRAAAPPPPPPPSEPARPRRGRRPRAPRTTEVRGELGFEAKLWQAADKLRNNMDAAEYKHVVLGLIFLKYISDAFEAARGPGGEDPPPGATFFVPVAARWATLAGHATSATIGAMIDAAMGAIERANPSLRGVLPRHYERLDLDRERLGELVLLVGTIGLGAPEDRARDVLGRVYEYFLTSFAAAEGKNGGQFYTPRSVVELLVAMLAPFRGTVYDPACGSGGLFVQSERFLEEHGGRPGDIRIFGQESNPTTWRLARMNLAIRGIACDLGPEHADSFHRDLHPELRADYVLANPPFNSREWGRERLVNDPRWRYGLPPEHNANYAWVQHFVHHLAPRGLAGFVLANGAMSSTTAGEGEIRRALCEDDLVDCMVALPGKLFYSTQIPVSLWFLARDKADPGRRDRRRETLFIDARALGVMIDRVHRELQPADIERIVDAYHAWRGEPGAGEYADQPGFCRAVTLDELRANDHTLVPGHYVGASPELDDLERGFAERFAPLARAIEGHLDHARELEAKIRLLLRRLSE
ncbi:MAG: type I restriction-modification system subunit M [Myxococcales bacterium]|nr:type I restriction-modification system subunit M [Myxococcales bacterium]